MEKLLELLKQAGISEDLINKFKTSLNGSEVLIHKADEKYVLDDGKMIPKHRLDEVLGEKTALTAQVTQLENDIKEIKKSAKGNDELTAKITELQTANNSLKTENEKAQSKLKKTLAVKEALMNAGVVDSDARDLLVPKFDVDSLELDESGKVKNFDEKLKPIKENKTLSTLFGEVKIEGKKPEPPKPGADGLFTKEQVDKMSQEEVNTNFEAIQKSMAGWN